MANETTADAAPSAARGFGLALRIVAVTTLASVALFASEGVSEASVRAWVRGTARASVTLFLLAIAARPLVQLSPSGAARWLLAHRRQLGVAAAYAQLLHLVALAWLFRVFVKYEPNLVNLVGGGLGFAFYFAMALTSSDAAVAALGRRKWRMLHTAGVYWIWGIFALTNAGRIPDAFAQRGLPDRAIYVGIELALFAVLALRIAAALRGRRGAAARRRAR